MAFDLAISGCIASIWSLYLALGQSFLASASISSAFKPNKDLCTIEDSLTRVKFVSFRRSH